MLICWAFPAAQGCTAESDDGESLIAKQAKTPFSPQRPLTKPAWLYSAVPW
jgi:hypothetical protein